MPVHPFPAAVAAALRDHDVTGPLVVACSGGGDSLALLRACAEVGHRPVTAAYFDHRQRDDSADDGRHVAALCLDWNVAFAAGGFRGERGASEATLRAARYGWLGHAARSAGAGAVLTGHTADDDAETVLMRLLRGTGVAGLAGIPSVSAPAMLGGGVLLARPMLGVTGRDARAFLVDRGVDWREDPTNATPDRTRSRLRTRVLPRLAEINPRWREAVLRLSGLAGEEAGATESLAESVAARASLFVGESRIEVREHELAPLTDAARAAVFRVIWRRAGWPRQKMGADAWRRLAALRDGGVVHLPHDVIVRHATGEIVLRR